MLLIFNNTPYYGATMFFGAFFADVFAAATNASVIAG